MDPDVEELQRRTFDWFVHVTDREKGLTPDRWPTRTFSSVAAVGFALTCWPIGVEPADRPARESFDQTGAAIACGHREAQDRDWRSPEPEPVRPYRQQRPGHDATQHRRGQKHADLRTAQTLRPEPQTGERQAHSACGEEQHVLEGHALWGGHGAH
jgi:hypothetical protein